LPLSGRKRNIECYLAHLRRLSKESGLSRDDIRRVSWLHAELSPFRLSGECVSHVLSRVLRLLPFCESFECFPQ
jgi:hypothetical protein